MSENRGARSAPDDRTVLIEAPTRPAQHVVRGEHGRIPRFRTTRSGRQSGAQPPTGPSLTDETLASRDRLLGHIDDGRASLAEFVRRTRSRTSRLTTTTIIASAVGA